jgi:hypothetical protein
LNTLYRFVALLLCLAISPLQLLAADAQTAGQVSALIPAATRNDKPAKAKDAVYWNDLLKTAAAGRLRASLSDGSILSLGSNSEIKVVQHDAASQQTSLEMTAGQLRSRVVKITQPNGKFEVHTPNATIGVVGTDFFVQYANNKTTVICYTGQVGVTPQAGAQAQGASSGNGPIQLVAGQMVEITSEIPPAGFQSQPTPLSQQTASMEGTTVGETAGATGVGVAAGSSHLLKFFLIGLAVAGASAGIAATVNTSPKRGPSPTDPCKINPQLPQCG